MEKQKRLINLFLAANVLDTATTYFALHFRRGFAEIGPYASSSIYSEHNEALILKTCVTVGLIGLYALTQSNRGKYSDSIEKAMKANTILVWSVVLLNALQIAIS